MLKNFFKKTLLILLMIITLTGITFTGFGYKMYHDALAQENLNSRISQIQSDPDYTPLSDLPETYKNAVVAVEDHRFYSHNGIDPIAIGRAFRNDIVSWSLREGGSTITQQLAKNLYFTQEKNVLRKIAEIFMAFRLENTYDKDEILELYVNTIYFGQGLYGIKNASEGYFNKSPGELTDYECTLLAGIPNAPSVYDPSRNPGLARQRQKYVLQAMVRYGYITEAESEEISDSQ